MTTKIRKSVSALHAHDLKSLTRAEIHALVANTIPVGMCFVWNGTANEVPDGYAVCNGAGGRTPNLTNRTAIGAGNLFPLNSTGGKYNFDIIIEGQTDGHSLTTKEVPPHTHGYQSNVLYDSERTGKKKKDAANKAVSTYKTSIEMGGAVEGKADPHSHAFGARFKHEAIAPYVSKFWVMRVAPTIQADEVENFSLSKRTRVTPRLADLTAADCDMYTAEEIKVLARAILPKGSIAPWWGDANNVPKGWRLLDGKDGRQDFRDRMVVGAGGNYPWNSTGGTVDVRYTKTQADDAAINKTELFPSNIPGHQHRYQSQFLSAGVGVESDKGNMTSVPEHSARYRPMNYNTGNAETKGVAWGNQSFGVDPHSHTYTIEYVHKCMTPFFALHWLIKVEDTE